MPTDAVTLDVEGRAVRLSSPDKPYFPALGLTKRDVAEYLIAVGGGALDAVRGRPTTMERWPGGVTGARVVLPEAHPARGRRSGSRPAP